MKFTCMYYEFHISECVHVNIDSFTALSKKITRAYDFRRQDKIKIAITSEYYDAVDICMHVYLF